MPFAVALLAHPAGSYAFLMIGIAMLAYGVHVRRFLPLFTGASSGALTCLAFLHSPPSVGALALLALAVGLLHLEFRLPAGGALGALGFAAAALGSWLALGGVPLTLRLVGSAAGALGLAFAIGRAWRQATLPP
jgi:membrane-bound ClpP family serine protease